MLRVACQGHRGNTLPCPDPARDSVAASPTEPVSGLGGAQRDAPPRLCRKRSPQSAPADAGDVAAVSIQDHCWAWALATTMSSSRRAPRCLSRPQVSLTGSGI
jgi:hypothetical protein